MLAIRQPARQAIAIPSPVELSGLLVYTYAPEAEGHGTDAAIDAYHNKRGEIRGRIPFVKTLARRE